MLYASSLLVKFRSYFLFLETHVIFLFFWTAKLETPAFIRYHLYVKYKLLDVETRKEIVKMDSSYMSKVLWNILDL